MVLHQIQAVYHAEHDRVLLRASFGEKDDAIEEIRAWLTRRLVKNLWPGIIQALETQVALNHPQAAHARAEIVNMQHQAAMMAIRSHGNLDTPFATDLHRFPFGEQPILISRTHISVGAKQMPRVNFTCAEGGSFEIAFTLPMLHGLCTLLKDAVKQAGWNVELRLPVIAAENFPERRVLN